MEIRFSTNEEVTIYELETLIFLKQKLDSPISNERLRISYDLDENQVIFYTEIEE